MMIAYGIKKGEFYCFKLFMVKRLSQDKPTQKCLMTAISRLPLEGDIKKLQGASGYRLRVGNFRVLFDVNGVIIDIIDIGNRG